MSDHILTKAKAYAALVGSVVTALLGLVPPQTPTWTTLTVLSAVATAVATFAIPNKDPKGRHQAESVQPPERGAVDVLYILGVVVLVLIVLFLLGVLR